ncbi:MAG: NlpC/P60 family protein [Candidatus Gastranaerophilales bacterium]|nr:NlpC/P60 family protein [Candidatus Gastranaerophilales bacterium]
MVKFKRKIGIALLLFSGMAVFGLTLQRESLFTHATTVSEVQEQITNQEGQISAIQSQIAGYNEQIENLTDEQDLVEEVIADIQAEIVNTLTSIGMLEDEIAEKEREIADKEADIAKTQEEYEKAEAIANQQQQDMMNHVRLMYESGTPSYLSLLLAGDGLKDTLNRMDYIEKLYDYDRTLLDQYIETQNQVQALWDQLEAEHAQLEEDKRQLDLAKADLKEQENNLNVMLDKRRQEADDYEAEIKRARQQAAVAQAQLQQEQRELKRLQQEQKRLEQELKKTQTSSSGGGSTPSSSGGGSAESYGGSSGSGLGQQIADFACQYVGNPYVAGGTSLTNGADCSGFTYRVYQEFGYSIPRTSYAQRSAGVGVSYEEAQPGDIICYENHVALYIGNGKIVHASTERTGIKIGNANYRTILAVRRIV